MDKRTEVLIFAAATNILLSMMATIIESTKRKQVAKRIDIKYSPMDERDRQRIEYLDTKVWRNDTICVNMLRLRRASFFRFSKLFRDCGLLEDTIHMCVEEQVAMFLHTVGHNLRIRVVGGNFGRSGETVSRYLANLVASGIRTSSGFKQVHLNACARAVNEKFLSALTGDQIRSHLKTWQKKFKKVQRLRKVSGAIWDEDNFVITLDEGHYNDCVKDNKGDAKYLNKPIVNYGEMLTIFGSTMATGNFAKDSSSVLGTPDVDTNDDGYDVLPTTDNEERSSASKPKKAKINDDENEGLIGAFNRVGDKLADAIIKVGTSANDVPADLFDNLNSLPGFERQHISFYYAYLVANPHIARAFNALPFANKLDWVAMFISDKFPDQM